MKANRARDTSPELALRRALRRAGVPGYRLHWRSIPGRPDVAYPGRRVAIFVNGCFWHRCPKCTTRLPKTNTDFWATKFALNVERDRRKRRQLETAGWRVAQAWECDLTLNPDQVAAELIAELHLNDFRTDPPETPSTGPAGSW